MDVFRSWLHVLIMSSPTFWLCSSLFGYWYIIFNTDCALKHIALLSINQMTLIRSIHNTNNTFHFLHQMKLDIQLLNKKHEKERGLSQNNQNNLEFFQIINFHVTTFFHLMVSCPWRKFMKIYFEKQQLL